MAKLVLILADAGPFSERMEVRGEFDTKDAALKEAEYQIARRWEKDGWRVERVIIGEDVPADVIEIWHDRETRREAAAMTKQREAEERAELERLKAKYER